MDIRTVSWIFSSTPPALEVASWKLLCALCCGREEVREEDFIYVPAMLLCSTLPFMTTKHRKGKMAM